MPPRSEVDRRAAVDAGSPVLRWRERGARGECHSIGLLGLGVSLGRQWMELEGVTLFNGGIGCFAEL